MFVKDCMTKNPITISDKTTVFEALELMKKQKIRRLPVVRDEKLVGIVTELDLLRVSPSTATSLSVFELHYLLSKMVVKDVMTRDVIVTSPDATVEQAALLMRDNEIGGLPVMDKGKMVGIITETNLFDALLEHFGIRKGGVRVTLKAEDKPGQLAAIANAIKDAGGNIVSLATAQPVEGTGTIVVRVTGVDEESLIKILTDKSFLVIHVSE